MNKNFIKAIGLAATVIGMAATLVSNWVDDKKMEEKIEERVNEAMTKYHENERES